MAVETIRYKDGKIILLDQMEVEMAANKIGTFGLSILAKEFGIPFYIAAPTPTIDLMAKTG